MYALTVPAERRSLAAISAFIIAVTEEAELPHRRAYRLRLAVDETVTNIIQHGYEHCTEDDTPLIHIWAEITPQRVSVTIEDGGAPYDMTQATEPTDLDRPPEERGVGGLGVYLITHYVDDLRFERVNDRNINRLTVWKNAPD